MRDKGLGIAIAFAIIVFVFMWAQTNGFSSQPVASTDVVVRDSAPTVNDDIDRGFLPGHGWVDQTNSKTYQAIQTQDGAAVWTQTNVLTASLGSEYGNLFASDTATPAQVLATAGTFEAITAFDQAGDSTANVTLDTVNNTITILKAGDYLVSYSASYSGSASREFDMIICIDGVEQLASKTHRTLSATGAVGVAASGSIIANISPNEVLTLEAAPEQNGDSITVFNGSFAVVELPQ